MPIFVPAMTLDWCFDTVDSITVDSYTGHKLLKLSPILRASNVKFRYLCLLWKMFTSMSLRHHAKLIRMEIVHPLKVSKFGF
jgi:hypothetical protein